MLARALSATGTERSQGARDRAGPGARRRPGRAAPHPGVRPEPACVAATDAFVAKLKRPGDVEILQYRPSVQLPLTNAVGTGRVAWRAGHDGSRSSSACACAATDRSPGPSVELLSISAPIGREASCPRKRNLPPERRVEIARDEASPTIPPARVRAAAGRPGRRARRRQADRASALPGRPRGPLPARRRLAVPARQRRPGHQAALHAPDVDQRLDQGHGPERLEPRRPVQRVDGGRDRLVSQGLRAARAPTPRSPGRSASSRSTTARRCG